jgi:CBS-domain-containing membrane protein
MILREDVLKLAKDRQTSIKDIIKETNTVQSNTIMRDVYHELRIAEKDLAVVDDKGRFLGVITHSVLLMTLDERKGGDGIAES